MSEDEQETQTLRESILDYPVHWGRTYHRYKAGSYNYPNDEAELERFDLMHHIFTGIHGSRLFFAPVKDARRILDLGTGSGIWPIDLSARHHMPHAEKITGIDLSPTQPTVVPENVRFEIQDISEPNWQRPRSSIDYMHVRMMLGSLKDPAAIVRNAKRYLKPGTGWLEWHDPYPQAQTDDNSIPPKWAYAEWERELARASRSTNCQ